MCNLYARNRLFVIPIRSCNITIYYRLLRYSNLVVESDVLDENGFCILMVAEMICFLLVLTRQNITFSTTKSRGKMGRVQSFMLILVPVGFGRVKKIGPTSNSGLWLTLISVSSLLFIPPYRFPSHSLPYESDNPLV